MNELAYLERRIAARRRDLRHHARAARDDARRLVDLPDHVRRHPLVGMALGSAAGFGAGVALQCGSWPRPGRAAGRWARIALRTFGRTVRWLAVSAVMRDVADPAA